MKTRAFLPSMLVLAVGFVGFVWADESGDISELKLRDWKAEVFVPYDLLKPLQNVPPQTGTRWRANFYRVDYDGGKGASWDWARVGRSFHEYEKFGTLVFE